MANAMANPVAQFGLQTFERAVKTAAQGALLSYGGQQINLLDHGWKVIVLAAASAFITSVLTSVASIPVGDTSSPSLVKAKNTATETPAPVQPPSEVVKVPEILTALTATATPEPPNVTSSRTEDVLAAAEAIYPTTPSTPSAVSSAPVA